MNDNPRYVTPPELMESVTRLIARVISTTPATYKPADTAERITSALLGNGVEFIREPGSVRPRRGGLLR